MPQSDFILDGITSLDAGMNSGIVPELLQNNQLAFATNLTMRLGYARTRPPFKKLSLNYNSDLILQSRFETGQWQGACFFKSEYGFESIIASIGGRIFEIVPDKFAETATVFDRTPITNGVDDPNSSGTSFAALWQSERWMIITNGQQLPIFYDGQVSRRSFGPSTLVGTAAVDFTAPAIGSNVTITLLANYTGPFNSNVFIDGSLYQIVSSGTGYKITLKNLTESVAETMTAGTPLLIPNNLIGISVSGVNTTAKPGRPVDLVLNFGQPIPAKPFGGTCFLVAGTPSIRLPNDGTNYKNFFGVNEGPQFHCYAGPVSQTNHAAGIFEMFQPGGPQFFSPAGTACYDGPVNSTTQAGVLLQNFIIPAFGASSDAIINIPYNGPLGVRVIINGAVFEITATNNTPVPTNTIIATNVNDTAGTVHGPTSGDPTKPGKIFTIPEIPICKMGAYVMGRNWVVLPDGRSFIASDIVGGPSGSQAVDFRDAVLRFTENDYLDGGGKFVIPGNVGDINWLGGPPNLDQALGQGPLQVGTSEAIFSCASPVDRTEWKNLTNPILTVSLKGKGPLSFYGTIFVNSDTIFRAVDGIGSLVLARRDFDVWGNVPISREVQKIIDVDDQSLLGNSTAIQFDNRMLMSSFPFQATRGTAHQGIIALNLDPISGLRGKAPSIYDGLWTGLQIYQMVVGKFQKIERAFAFCHQSDSTLNSLFEINSTNDTDNFDNDTIPITTSMETAAMFSKSKGKGSFDSIKLEDGEIYLSELKGIVTVESWFKPIDSTCWTPWHRFSICADNLVTGQPLQYRHRLGLGKPDIKKCDPTNQRPFCVGTSLQVRLQITGKYRFMGALFKAVPFEQTEFSTPICEPLCDVVAAGQTCEPCKAQGDCLTFPFVFYNLNGGKSYENNLVTIDVTCPNGSVVPVTIPAGTVKYTLPFPPDYTGDYPPLVMACLDGFIVREVASGSTQSEIDTIVLGMIDECVRAHAAAEAPCGPSSFGNAEVFFVHTCGVGETLTFTGTLPSWITLDTVNSRLVGEAGTFTGATPDDATAAAQNAINEFGNTALTNLTLKCVSASVPLVLVNAETVGWGGGEDAIGFVEVAGTFYGLSDTKFYSSVDGVNWVSLGAHGISQPSGVAFGAGLFVVSSLAGTNRMYSSPDGIVWTPHAAGIAAGVIAFGAGVFVGVANGGAVTTSANGTAWASASPLPGLFNGRGLSFGLGLFVSAGQNGASNEIYSSPDGIVWTLRFTEFGGSFWTCGFSDGLFVVGGTGGEIRTSPNGTAWTLQAPGPAAGETITAAGGGNGLHVIGAGFGSGSVYQSTDAGVTWTFVRTEPSNRFPASQGIQYYSAANVIDVGFFS